MSPRALGAALIALVAPAIASAQRPDDPGSRALYRFDAGDVVLRHDSPGGGFRVHYTRAGRHAVPRADVPGTPAFVEMVAERYDHVLAFYSGTLGFRAPLSDGGTPGGDGGDDRFDVYLVDFAGRGDGAYVRERCLPAAPSRCSGYMAQENDFAGYGYPSLERAVKILASHELFHGVQAAYDADQGSVLSEGTAVWATEKYDPNLSDFEAFIHGYLDHPDRPLDEPLPGPVDAFSYGSALFFQFLDERFGTELIPILWEAVEDGAGGEPDPQWLATLAALLPELHAVELAEAFTEFAAWNLFTGRSADPGLAYARGAGYPAVKVEAVTLPYADARLRRFRASTLYVRALVGARDRLTAALTGPAEERADLSLWLAGRTGVRQGWPVPVEDGPVDASGWETAFLLVVNTALEGNSRRPGLCFGSPEEVAACRTAAGEAPEEDAGAPDAAVEDAALPDAALPDAGLAPGADASAPAGSGAGSGGCQSVPGAPAPLWPAPALALLLWRLRRRRAGSRPAT